MRLAVACKVHACQNSIGIALLFFSACLRGQSTSSGATEETFDRSELPFPEVVVRLAKKDTGAAAFGVSDGEGRFIQRFRLSELLPDTTPPPRESSARAKL